MSKFNFRPFWSYDILKTQKWLEDMSQKGYKLVKVNAVLRVFVFEKVSPKNNKYLVFYEKGLNGYPKNIIDSSDYNGVCYTKNFYVIEQNTDDPSFTPTYDMILSRNQKIKFIVGNILLFFIFIFGFMVFTIFLVMMFSDGVTVTVEETEELTAEETLLVIFALLRGIGVLLIQVWMVYTFFKLKKTNKELEALCGEEINLSFTIPTDTILSKEEIKRLKREKKLVRKMKIGWFYSPDTAEKWLEKMEEEGYNLIRMSKVGNSFYFIKGTSRKMKYHIDYQKKKGATYFKINEESGWKLYFTSLTRYMAISMWGQEYSDIQPRYYSDTESKVKHAKSFMLAYVVWMLPVSLLYFVLFGMAITSVIKTDFTNMSFPMIFAPSMLFLVGCEFLYFAFRLIRYYNRVKKST